MSRRAANSIFVMSEQEKYEQVGRLAEEYSQLKGELNHVNEKVAQARAAYQVVSNAFASDAIKVHDGKLYNAPRGAIIQRNTPEITGMLSTRELIEALEHVDRVNEELQEKAQRLRSLAPPSLMKISFAFNLLATRPKASSSPKTSLLRPAICLRPSRCLVLDLVAWSAFSLQA